MSSDEYKVMGLAPYGDARKTLPIFEELIRLQPDGSYTIPCLVESGTDLEQETLSQSRRYLESRLGPPRELEEELTQYHMDIAAGMQVALQNALLHLLRASRKETGLDRLCLAGGVALNCVANGVISRSGLFKQLFVQPAAGDDGTSLGAAMHVHRTLEPKAKYPRMRPPFLGPEYSDEAIQEAILKHPKCEGIRHAEETTLLETAARAIDEGKVVAWFQGRMEFGPRALGARSILANPAIPTMREHVNALVKKRENFRPFAPAVLAERAARIFHVKEGAEEMYENMLFVTQVREEFRAKLPSITHVDGSARVQVVPRDSNALFYRLISKLEEINGMPVVLNTSFNVKGQPIVCSPAEAVETFLAANLDMLVIGLFVVIRKS
jgi:carbamoyltransferase